MPGAVTLIPAIGLAIISLIAATLLVIVPRYAHERGHGFIWWFILQVLTLNPVYLMLLLVMLPNRSRNRMRERFAAELDAKLKAQSHATVTFAGGAVPAKSIGDVQTAVSIGELPTASPKRADS